MRKWLSIVLLGFVSFLLVGCNTSIDKLNDVIEAQEFTPIYRYYSHRHYTKGIRKVDYISKAYDVLKEAGYSINRDKYTQSDSLLQVGNQLYFSFKFDVDGNQRDKNLTYDRAIMRLDLIEETVTVIKLFQNQTDLWIGVNLHGLYQNRYLIYDYSNELIIEDLKENSVIKSYKPVNRMVPVQFREDTLMIVTLSSVILYDFNVFDEKSYTLPKDTYVIDSTKYHIHYKGESDVYVDMRQLIEVSKETYQAEYDYYNLAPINEILVDNQTLILEDLDDHIRVGEVDYDDKNLLRSQPFLAQIINTYSSGHLGFEIYVAEKLDSETYLLYSRYYDLGLATIVSSHTMIFTFKGNGEMHYVGYIPLRTYAGKVKL
ncbi:hypothetical protein N7603_01775 [Acholeplasma vituli]|uniref:Lipoprotein n=1 Tax=Paracholeplasma vituli TaxID=69473 RepID=A0ABT2PTW2_9MOLU|nr:hypothetical protein [Paracholeplasma vituli]MCU0104382.1 hypothetical protein [Paracholeplasma vituli]